MPVARIDCEEVRDPKKSPFWTLKVEFLDLTPFNPPTKTPFWVHFVAESGPFGRLGGCVAPPPPGYGPGFWSLLTAVVLLYPIIADFDVVYTGIKGNSVIPEIRSIKTFSFQFALKINQIKALILLTVIYISNLPILNTSYVG